MELKVTEQLKSKDNSRRTSRKQISAGFKKINWDNISHNLDIGGGKYDDATVWLRENGVINHIYDPYNRSLPFNRTSLHNSQICETATIFNVFNVIPEREERDILLKIAKKVKTEAIYITVYEKNKSGEAEITKCGYQANRTLKSYLPEVQEMFPQAYIKYKMIIIKLKGEVNG